MAESMSKEVYFLNQVANQKYNKDFAVNMVQVNNTLRSISKYLIVMQKGIDDLNRDILEVVRDLIDEIIIIFNGGDLSSLDFEWGDLKYVLQAIGQFFGFPIWNGTPEKWNPLKMAEHFVKNFVNFFVEAIKNIFGKNGLIRFDLLPTIPLSLFAPTTPELLANGSFDGPESMAEGNGWMYDPSTGRNNLGSAKYVVIPGERGVQMSTPIQVAEGQKVNASGWAKWAGVSGTGAAFRIALRWFDGVTQIGEELLGSINASASGGWSQIKKDNAIAPANADSMCLTLIVENTVTSGAVWFDDCSVKKPTTSLPQQFVEGLVQSLEDAVDWVRKLVEKLIGNPVANIQDAIQDAVKFANQLGSILSGGNPSGLLPTFSGNIIGSLNNTLNQIGDVFNGIVVTPINSIVTKVKDWFFDLIGWKSNTSSNHQSLKDNVWSGATQNGSEVVAGKTDEEIRQAVAALKARAEASQTAMEMEYLSAFPIWQGLIPGGEVTVPLQMVNYDIPASSLSVSMTLFRPRNSFPIEKISFMAGVGSGTNPGTWTAARLLLMSYNEDTNRWTCVGKTNDFKSQLGLTTSWIHSSLLEAYTPRAGEDMAIIAKPYAPSNQAFGVAGFSNDTVSPYYTIPTSTLHPRGGRASVDPTLVSDVGDSFSSDDAAKVVWMNGVMEFYHYSPDLGQVETFPPLYWFDDFNSFGSTSTRYKTLSTTSLDASFSSGKMEFNGSTDGRQGIIYTTPMNTDSMAVQADVVYDAVNYGQTTCSVLGLHQDINGKGGVHLTIDRTAGGSVVMRTDGTISTPITGTTVRASIMSGHNPEGRWQLFYDAPTSTYRVVHNGATLSALTWTDTSNSVGRGKIRRYSMLSVGRASFQDSLGWDNLLIQDI